MSQNPFPTGVSLPYLEHYPEPGGAPHRIPLDPLPFRIGRNMTAQYVIYSPEVSKEHLEIFRRDGFRVRDLGSTNGTFVNGQRIQEAALENGDIIHLAHKELRFGFDASPDLRQDLLVTNPAVGRLPQSLIRTSEYLRELLRQQRVRVVFQPIVELADGTVFGYEALGRGTHASLSPSPAELFTLADLCNLAGDLSETFRREAMREAVHLPATTSLFFNLHSSEVPSKEFLASLDGLRAAFPPQQQLVLEVHEGLAVDVATMRRLRDKLNDLGIGLAYDDFGAGQARLKELAEVPPDYIKLDRSLVQNIQHAKARQELVLALNRVVTDLGVKSIAEGIESAEEAQTCQQLGCHLGQGYFFGHPQPLALLQVRENTPVFMVAKGSDHGSVRG